MVFRYSIECDTCSTPHTLRISVGHNAWQDHTFMCTNCSENIEVGMAVDYDTISVDIQCLNNCTQTQNEGCIVNLNSEFIISEDQIHKDGVFPWMNEIHKNLDLSEHVAKSSELNGLKFHDAFLTLGGNQQLTDDWRALKKAWSLEKNGQKSISKKIIHDFFLDKNIERDPSLIEWQFGFSQTFISSEYNKDFVILNDFCKKIYEQYPMEFERFKQFYNTNLRKDHFYRYLELYSDYFKNFSEYSQALLYVKNKKDIPERFKAVSINFKKTKMFYGDAYEIFTSNIVVLACMNNIASGRPFDQFKSMDLKKYLTLNKASRVNPFKDVDELSIFTTCIDSSLRNASHHGAMKFKKGIIKYRSGGSGAEKTISYTNYIEKCNKIAILSMILLMNELVITGIR